ncbi:elongation factor Ts [Candidatus Parcubacteria bacterium]|jgi:elongation factor Ts|nr:elongation factor Ts [Candidatus Parcubacteria bacterium]
MSLELIKDVRQITGAGMSDVKKALDEAGGDKDKAIEILRKAGQKIAAKKSAREIKEGVIALAKGDGKIAIVSLGCETDFVARNEDFIKTVDELAGKLLELGKDKFESWATEYIQNELIVKIGENLQLIQFDVLEGNAIGTYLHSNKKIASIVVLSEGSEDTAKEVAMHAAAMAPKYLKPEEVNTDELEKEKEIYREQLKKEGKPENMLDKILEGKIQKYYTEVCLLKQTFVKDDKKTIEQFIEENKAVIDTFGYYSL